jgi:hypothetical protein
VWFEVPYAAAGRTTLWMKGNNFANLEGCDNPSGEVIPTATPDSAAVTPTSASASTGGAFRVTRTACVAEGSIYVQTWQITNVPAGTSGIVFQGNSAVSFGGGSSSVTVRDSSAQGVFAYATTASGVVEADEVYQANCTGGVTAGTATVPALTTTITPTLSTLITPTLSTVLTPTLGGAVTQEVVAPTSVPPTSVPPTAVTPPTITPSPAPTIGVSGGTCVVLDATNSQVQVFITSAPAGTNRIGMFGPGGIPSAGSPNWTGPGMYTLTAPIGTAQVVAIQAYDASFGTITTISVAYGPC